MAILNVSDSDGISKVGAGIRRGDEIEGDIPERLIKPSARVALGHRNDELIRSAVVRQLESARTISSRGSE
jgi:hypothetical protein